MRLKYGKLPFVASHKDFLFSKYRTPSPLPPRPPCYGRETAVADYGMLGNDQVGDCAIAGPMHLAMIWTAAAGNPVTFTTQSALAAYSAIAGYDPNNPETDVGCQLRDVLEYWRTTGFTDAAGNIHKIGAYLNIQPQDMQSIDEAMYLFAGVVSGFEVPASMQDQFAADQPLTVVSGSPIEGGHCMPEAGLRDTYIPGLTWGAVAQITLPFHAAYCDEVWAVISQDELNGNGASPEGFDWAQLQADLAAL